MNIEDYKKTSLSDIRTEFKKSLLSIFLIFSTLYTFGIYLSFNTDGRYRHEIKLFFDKNLEENWNFHLAGLTNDESGKTLESIKTEFFLSFHDKRKIEPFLLQQLKKNDTKEIDIFLDNLLIAKEYNKNIDFSFYRIYSTYNIESFKLDVLVELIKHLNKVFINSSLKHTENIIRLKIDKLSSINNAIEKIAPQNIDSEKYNKFLFSNQYYQNKIDILNLKNNLKLIESKNPDNLFDLIHLYPDSNKKIKAQDTKFIFLGLTIMGFFLSFLLVFTKYYKNLTHE